ncbi:PASTA domain-containing protein [Svornostia abyssi]|uniref:PASTA domain-containing protein n=1 Tax=Svornostia abyssi TaxID=2898438 RepID=A0ABY5PJE7_9ACTN|nr:PASTA domain-containing protein [Parviterribacteraceae bacterium J379]
MDISGRLEGCDIFAKDPITKVTASIAGPLQFTKTVALTKGELLWDSEGMRLKGDARITCATSGALKGSAAVDYRTPESWTLSILGSTDGPTCVMEEGFAIGDATVGGTITSKDGVVDGKITGRANVAAPILPFGTWAATFQMLMSGPQNKIATTFTADASNPAGFAKVTIGPDGKLVITLNLIGGTTDSGEEVPATDGYVDPASLLPPSAPVVPKARCKVPKIKSGATLASVRKALTKANCKAKVKRVRSKKVKKGRVVGLVLKPGRTLAAGTKVTVKVSAGAPTRKRS